MRLSGVDPGIIRELSGIYKPFVKAFKELVSNAYDADAKVIEVVLDRDYRWLEVRDNGIGMTPYHFERDFARLGGSTAWHSGGESPGGRRRIGYKGIGFLAVARYCSALTVESRPRRPFRGDKTVARGRRKAIPLTEVVGDLVDFGLVRDHITVSHVTAVQHEERFRLSRDRDWSIEGDRVCLMGRRALSAPEVRIEYGVDCSKLVLRACLDFDYLLGLERRADLSELENFCEIDYRPAEKNESGSFTRVRLDGLKEFVIRDLSAPPVKGKARNIVFKSGEERFVWELARVSPIHDRIPANVKAVPIARVRAAQEHQDLPVLNVRWRDAKPQRLLRPIFVPGKDTQPLEETLTKIEIKRDDLHVEGYIMARSEVIYPAEFRGIAVRVRDVMIGNAGYFGWENILSGPRKAALGQINGELRVLKGFDAGDAINPGRESFYEENPHYRILKETMCGSEETIGGILGKAVKDILDRIHVRSQVKEAVVAARQRRKILADIAGAVGQFARRGSNEAKNLTVFFRSGTNGCQLADARGYDVKPTHQVAGFELETVKGLGSDFVIDFRKRRVRLDYNQDVWDTTVFLHGHFYDVAFKLGRPTQPICEFDHESRRIYVNFGHPVKQNMDDEGFLKSAILLPLAYHAAPQDADAMMNLALNMMAFRNE